MAKYLVTGGCGFIGSLLTRQLLSHGHDVIVIDDLSNGKIIYPKATLIQADIRDYDYIRPFFNQLDGCFHLAAIPIVNMSLEKWPDFHTTNLEGSLNIFRAVIDS